MLNRRGFTVVELVVVMVVMAILLVLAGFSINSSRANARDAERAADIDIVARGLETRYTGGALNKSVTVPTYVTAGAYPGTDEMKHIMGQAVAGFSSPVTAGYGPIALPGTNVEAFSPPDVTGSYGGFTLATSCTVEDLVCIGTAVNKDIYYYEPIDKNGAVCAQGGCVRFNLYYKAETITPALQQVRSRHQ